eukprot:8957752-Pyramimonas_sp.AAC.1
MAPPGRDAAPAPAPRKATGWQRVGCKAACAAHAAEWQRELRSGSGPGRRWRRGGPWRRGTVAMRRPVATRS